MTITTRFSSNVISAKARAMFGHALKEEQYAALLHCHSVSEVAAYLKNETTYSSVLSGINEATIHRGHLETLLRRKLWNEYASLIRYDYSVGSHMADYLIEREEIEQIVLCLRLINAGRGDEFVLSMPDFFAAHSRLDMMRMSRVSDFNALLQALKETFYEKLLQPFAPESGTAAPLTEIETALYTHLIETLYETINDTSGELRKQLISLYGARIDAQNVMRILRLKTFFGADPDRIRRNLLPVGQCIPERLMEKMIAANDAEEVMRLLLSSSAGKWLPESQRQLTHDLDQRIPYFSARHYMHFSTYPMVVLLSYMMLMETELNDIINIIEGIRYGLPPEDIKPILIQMGMERK